MSFKINSLNKGLIFHAPLLNNCKDLTPNANHGTNNGAVIRNHGCYFDGSSYIITKNIIASLNTQSYSFWIKPNIVIGTAPYQRIFSSGNNAYKPDIAYNENTGEIGFRIVSLHAEWVNSGVIMTIGSWNYITFILNNLGNVLIYLNGTLSYTNTFVSGDISLNNTITIGARYNFNETTNGNISDIKIFDYALSTDQISSLYNNSNSIKGNVLDMPLNSNTGYNDISGNYYHGINNGTILVGNGGYFDGVVGTTINGSGYNLREEECTVSLWYYKNTTTTNQRIIRSLGANTNRFYLLDYNVMTTVHGNNVARNGSISLTSGNWYHLVWYWKHDGYIVKHYVNGILDYEGTYDGVSSGGDAILHLGTSTVSETNTDGTIKDIRIYNRALNENEIKLLYKQKSHIGILV